MIRVMVVDDSKLMRALIKKLLSGSVYEVVCEAENGEVALRILDECRPDVMIVDLNMPVMNGFELVEKLREMNANVKIVVLTALDQRWAVDKMRNLRVNAFISKPVSRDKLLEVLNGIVAS